MLSLAEEIFLLSLLEKKEALRLPSSLSLPFSLAGAVLFDLFLSKFIKLENGQPVPCAAPDQIQDAQMKRTFIKIQQASKLKKLAYWVYLLGMRGKRITNEIMLSLVEKSVLVEDRNYYQWKVQEDGTAVPKHAKYILKRDIRDTIFCQSLINERMIAIIDLLDASDMMDHLFTTDEMVFVRKKIKSLKREEHISPEFLDLLPQMKEAIDYAIASAVMK